MEKKLYKKPSVEEVRLDDDIQVMMVSGDDGGTGSGGSSGGGKKPGGKKSAEVPEMYSNPFGDNQ